jgi:hypothetical protein
MSTDFLNKIDPNEMVEICSCMAKVCQAMSVASFMPPELRSQFLSWASDVLENPIKLTPGGAQ